MGMGFRLKKASFIMGIVLLVNEVFILTLGVVDYYQTGKFSNFQIITVIILLYAVFYGKKDLKKLDIFAQKLVAKWRNEPAPIIEEQVELTGMAYAKQEMKNWVLHLSLFVVVHIFFLYGLAPVEQWRNWLETGIVLNKAASRVSQVWAIILLVDTVISFSYVLFPKKEKGKEKLLS
ncbi:hypothetical protein [Bacillus paranthracis]|uniref:hypothetical protein n=1 Tax=Bacillus paranthracis TaxID=2026186 RepID=UPI0039A0DAA1